MSVAGVEEENTALRLAYKNRGFKTFCRDPICLMLCNFTLLCRLLSIEIKSLRHKMPFKDTFCDRICFASGRIFVLHVPGLSELEGIEFFKSLG